MTREEYTQKYLMELPRYNEKNIVLDTLVLEDGTGLNTKSVWLQEKDGVSVINYSHLAIYGNNEFLVYPEDDISPDEITDEYIASVQEKDVEEKLKKVWSRYNKCYQHYTEMYDVLDNFTKSRPNFRGDEHELANEIEKAGACCDLVGRSGFDFRRTFYVYPNREVRDKVKEAMLFFYNPEHKEAKRYASWYGRIKESMEIVTEIAVYGKEWLSTSQNAYDEAKGIVDDRERRRNAFKNAQVHFCADRSELIELLKKVSDIQLRYLGRSCFASRNSVAINVFPEINGDTDDIPEEKIEEQRILSDAIYEYMVKKDALQKEEDFVTAFDANNKHGLTSIVLEGGRNHKYVVPENYKCILSVMVSATKDHRQNLKHTCHNLYIDTSKICQVRGTLHLEVPEQYMGKFIGKGGSHINKVLDELRKINPNISRINVHKGILDLKSPEFTTSIIPERISKQELVEEYFDFYATDEEKKAYNLCFSNSSHD